MSGDRPVYLVTVVVNGQRLGVKVQQAPGPFDREAALQLLWEQLRASDNYHRPFPKFRREAVIENVEIAAHPFQPFEE
jgi:hypothetical protein